MPVIPIIVLPDVTGMTPLEAEKALTDDIEKYGQALAKFYEQEPAINVDGGTYARVGVSSPLEILAGTYEPYTGPYWIHRDRYERQYQRRTPTAPAKNRKQRRWEKRMAIMRARLMPKRPYRQPFSIKLDDVIKVSVKLSPGSVLMDNTMKLFTEHLSVAAQIPYDMLVGVPYTDHIVEKPIDQTEDVNRSGSARGAGASESAQASASGQNDSPAVASSPLCPSVEQRPAAEPIPENPGADHG
jgi:hypothetical protein